jgi:hypothetical protein
MPNLPTLTVTQAQADRLLAAFGSAANYKAWLRETVILYVTQKEAQTSVNSVYQKQSDDAAQLTTDLASS